MSKKQNLKEKEQQIIAEIEKLQVSLRQSC